MFEKTVHPHPEGWAVCEVGVRPGSNYFSMCATVSSNEPLPGGKVPDRWLIRCGQLDDSDWPEHLRPLLKWHLVSINGTPLHYAANPLFFAGDKDCYGLRKGEVRQFRDKGGVPAWEPCYRGPPAVWAPECPPPFATPDGVVIPYRPHVRVGEGKVRELDLARSAAVWPEATDEELIAATKETLLARLPALQEQFRKECARYLEDL